MWARIAASAAAPSRASMARTMASCSSSARAPRPSAASEVVATQRHRAVDHLELLDQVAVVAGEVELAVEALVGARERVGVGDERAVAGDHLPEDADLLGRGVLGGEAGGEALELGAHHVELAELVVVEARDDEAAAVAGEDGLGLQPLQRLADRGARDAEALGELGFDQPVAGAELARSIASRTRL